jgi:hypothetical protein
MYVPGEVAFPAFPSHGGVSRCQSWNTSPVIDHYGGKINASANHDRRRHEAGDGRYRTAGSEYCHTADDKYVRTDNRNQSSDGRNEGADDGDQGSDDGDRSDSGNRSDHGHQRTADHRHQRTADYGDRRTAD